MSKNFELMQNLGKEHEMFQTATAPALAPLPVEPLPMPHRTVEVRPPADVKPLELKPETAGQMIIAIISLAALVLGFCLLSGLAVGGILRIARRFGYSAAEGSMTTLHLEGK